MQPREIAADQSSQASLKKHCETLRRAAIELKAIELPELRAVDTQEAVRQLFGHIR